MVVALWRFTSFETPPATGVGYYPHGCLFKQSQLATSDEQHVLKSGPTLWACAVVAATHVRLSQGTCVMMFSCGYTSLPACQQAKHSQLNTGASAGPTPYFFFCSSGCNRSNSFCALALSPVL